jgi:ABC-type sugar transport system substrate-binding protein
MMKRLVIIMCVLFVVSFLVVCTKGGGSASETEKTVETSVRTTGEAKKRIFFTNAFYTAPYCAPLNDEVNAVARELGIDITIADGIGDAQTQLDQINTAIAEKYDGILYFPADAASSVNIVKALLASKVPFVVVDNKVDESVLNQVIYVGADMYKQGFACGEMALELMPNGGNVVIVEGAAGTAGQIFRTQGFKDAIKDSTIKILDAQLADWDPAKAMKVAEDFINKYGDKIDCIFTQDDGMYSGAARAVDNAGLGDKVHFVSIGANSAALQAIKSGKLYGSITQFPREEGRLGLETLFKVMNSENVPSVVDVPAVAVTKANVDNYKDPGW